MTNANVRQAETKIRDTLSDLDEKIQEGAEKVSQVVTDVDKRLHKDPWPVVAGIAVSALFIGFIMGATRR